MMVGWRAYNVSKKDSDLKAMLNLSSSKKLIKNIIISITHHYQSRETKLSRLALYPDVIQAA